MKHFFLDQHGCAKNQVDAEILISNLILAGYEYTDSAEKADLIIINSCGFIESAKKESLDAVVAARKKFPKKKIILAGCLAQRYSKILKTELPEADGIFGNGDLSSIGTAAEKIMAGRRVVLTPKQQGVCCSERLVNLSFKNSVYVKITEGCSNNCSFCAIPLIRGGLRSRPCSEIIKEIRALLKKGVYEINLIGQDLASYGMESPSAKKEHSPLYSLLKKITAIKGDFWIRLLYIHPDHFPLDILELIKGDSRLLPYFDIPFQSGDTEIIRAMNRHKTREEYTALVEGIRKTLPEAAIRTTFLTGFPGESDEAFENTLEFVKQIRADWAGAFAYSKEEDTAAAKMKKQVAKKTAAARKDILLELQEKITAQNLCARIKSKKGSYPEYDVLVEEVIDGGEDGKFAIGRAFFQAPDADGNFVVRFEADDRAAALVKPGSVVRARAVAVTGVDIDSVLLGVKK